MIDYKDNDLIDECLERFYETFELTLDTADYVPEKYNNKILAYIFKCMKKQFGKIERECRIYQKEQKARELMKKRAVKKRREQPGSKNGRKFRGQRSDLISCVNDRSECEQSANK